MKWLLYLLIVIPFFLLAEGDRLTFRDLPCSSSFLNKTVRIRGFFYEHEGKKILSSEPNLKTCCVGSSSKKCSQIVVIGDVTCSYFAVTVEGMLELEGETYLLKNAKIVQ